LRPISRTKLEKKGSRTMGGGIWSSEIVRKVSKKAQETLRRGGGQQGRQGSLSNAINKKKNVKIGFQRVLRRFLDYIGKLERKPRYMKRNKKGFLVLKGGSGGDKGRERDVGQLLVVEHFRGRKSFVCIIT